MKSVALGIVQGLTEFLPVSSSGHLHIIERFLTFHQSLLPFFVFLHLATLSAIVIFLHRQIAIVLSKKRVLLHLLVISGLTAVLGLAINFFLADFFKNKFLISFFMLVNGLILLRIKRVSSRRNYDNITNKDSIILGLVQGLAVLPGISRSGATISCLLKRGFKPEEAFTMSFLMAIPVFLGAFLLKARQLVDLAMPWTVLVSGFLAAFLSGFIALAIVKRFLEVEKFHFFGYYCIFISFLNLVL